MFFYFVAGGENRRKEMRKKAGATTSFFFLTPFSLSLSLSNKTTTTPSYSLPEHRPVQDVPDRPVGALPHLLEPKLLDARLVRRDRRALDADAVLEDGVGRVNRHLVVGRVAVRQAEVVVLDGEVEVGEDELLLDLRPDDAEESFFFIVFFSRFRG